jgi:hypothetical protein
MYLYTQLSQIGKLKEIIVRVLNYVTCALIILYIEQTAILYNLYKYVQVQVMGKSWWGSANAECRWMMHQSHIMRGASCYELNLVLTVLRKLGIDITRKSSSFASFHRESACTALVEYHRKHAMQWKCVLRACVVTSFLLNV